MIDLSKLLQNSIGETFYCTILGDVTLYKIHNPEETNFVLQVKDKKDNNLVLTKEGRMYNIENTECILFPSKDNRDWNTYVSKISTKYISVVSDDTYNQFLKYSEKQPKAVYMNGQKSKDNTNKTRYDYERFIRTIKRFNR